MGTYATAGSIYGLAPFNLTNTVLNTATVETYISDTEAEVNTYLAKYYSLPLLTTTVAYPILTDLTRNLTGARIMQMLYSSDAQNVNNWPQQIMDHAFKILEKISKGEIEIVDSSGNTVSRRTTNFFRNSKSEYAPVFGVDSHFNWRQSSQREEDEEDARALDD